MFYFAVNIGHHFFQSTLVHFQIEESLFGLVFMNCSLYILAYSLSFYSNCACLIDYKKLFNMNAFLLFFKVLVQYSE